MCNQNPVRYNRYFLISAPFVLVLIQLLGLHTSASAKSNNPGVPVGSATLSPASQPVLLTQPNSTRALALENITWRNEPFSPVSALPWGVDGRNRIVLFALNLNLAAGDQFSSVTSQAEDGTLRFYPLTVEDIDQVPQCPDVSRILLRLDDQLGDVGDVLVSVSLYGFRSNRVRVGIGHIGGGPPDDPPPTGTYTIDGHIMDSGGNGIGGVTVNLENQSGAPLTTAVTNSDGTFAFANLNAGISVTVDPLATNLLAFSPQTLANLNANESVMFKGQPRLYNVSGRAKLADGTAVSNVLMTCDDGVTTSTTLTDQNGSYSFAQMTAGRNIIITAALAGFIFPSVSLPNLDSDKTGVDFAATPLPSLSFFVAPNGRPTGNGTQGSPWDLQTALNQTLLVVPGSTLYLRGGTYTGRFTSKLNGLASAPIVVRSYPGEWAVLDGYWTATLANSVNATDQTLVLNSNVGYNQGQQVFFGDGSGEMAYLTNPQADQLTFKNVVRGWDGTTATTHTAGEKLFAAGTDGTLSIAPATGNYVYFRDFEITNSNPKRSFNQDLKIKQVRGPGVYVHGGDHGKFINLVVHDGQEGFYIATEATATEVYGCIIYNGGFNDWTRGHGQGLYMQNPENAPDKQVRNVISFNAFSDGMKAYAESQYASNFLFEHVISFNNGVLEGFPGNTASNGSAVPANSRTANIYAGTGNSNNPVNNIKLHNCYTYLPFDTKPSPANVAVGYQGNNATGFESTNNHIMGGNIAFAPSRLLSATVTGNTIYEQTSSLGAVFNPVVSASISTGGTIIWNSNTYFTQQPLQAGAYYPFRLGVNGVSKQACDGGTVLKYSDTTCSPKGGWKEASGFDANSTYAFAAPTGTEVFNIPNEYEPGRAHVVIYNWSLLPSVAVDLSNVLKTGDRYAIYAAENFLGSPVVTGTYDGKPVAFPMNGTAVAVPIGLGWTPATMRPQFGVFVVKKQ